ncbi:ABC transporter substrate-binding protein [Pseudomonas sp. NFIX28]|uniref:ABC transporter substrate-binding protein n=1 Tax=Pseudomonas sp. NFIX28 TaxID=1566235 RepID=UPI0008976A54|nr:ABC transporter substrate-binding protein [Pseudomonas sp. NFIX28]SDZ60307.1 branched-chain amino acid transport system substrate-binding protein [Pseudomonas sp. NFIX28]
MFKQIVSTAACSAVLLCSVVSRASEPVQVGFTATLTGDFASYGLDVRKGFELGVEKVRLEDDVNLQVKVSDDHGQPNDGVLAAGRFCEDQDTLAVAGYTFSSVALAAAPILKKCQMPIVASAITSPQLTGISPYFRRLIMTDAAQGAMMGEYVARTMGVKSVYILYQQDDYGIGINKAFADAFVAAGGTLAGQNSYNLGTKDFRTILAGVKQRKPDAIFIGGFYTEAAMIAKQTKALGINARLIGTDGALSSQLVQLGGSATEGMTLYGMFDSHSQTSPQTAAFVQQYVAKYQQEPNGWAALGYDTALTLGAAAKAARARGELNRTSMNDALSSTERLPGATGDISFQAGGDRSGSLHYFTVKSGKFVLADQ